MYIRPLTDLLPRRRVFVSFHHKDQWYRDQWDRLFGRWFLNHSVGEGEIADDNSAQYMKGMIQRDYITHASVVVVLVGPKTYCRKHVDWEISAGLNVKVGGRSGLVGIWLPNHTDFGRGISWKRDTTPPRLADNLDSGFANAYDWTDDVAEARRRIEEAFTARLDKADLADNSRLQFDYNRCD